MAITPWLFVGFDTIPQTAEEFDFPPEKSRRLMIELHRLRRDVSTRLVLIAVAIIIPYTDLLGQNHTLGYRAPWPTWPSARFGGVILAIPVLAGHPHRA